MSSRRVGQGRVYVQLGDVERLDFVSWVRSLADGRSYVSDGFAHALEFTVAGQSSGKAKVTLGAAGHVEVAAKVAFAPEVPKAVAYGTLTPEAGRRVVGDTVNLHAERTEETLTGLTHTVELVVNGRVRTQWEIPGDGSVHDLFHHLFLERSAWVALKTFPQLHTNPVVVEIGRKPGVAGERAMVCAGGGPALGEASSFHCRNGAAGRAGRL